MMGVGGGALGCCGLRELLTSISLSRFLNGSMPERALIPPQQLLGRKSTGLTVLGMMGNLSKKSSSLRSISLAESST